jgi:hypothetical protein
MNRNKMFLIASMLVPWISLPFIGKKSMKRFAPVAIFICLFVAIESIIAHKRRWWLFYEKINRFTLGEIPLIIGPFFIGSIWILKLTYGKFLRYFLVNLVVDTIFVYPGSWLLDRLGIANLIRLKKWQFLSIFLGKATLMYGVQMIVDKLKRKF